MKALRILALLCLSLVAGVFFACQADFDPQSKVDSVRLFSIKADKPYALPGETVTLEALTTDGRRDKPRPLRNFWVPILCLNPPDDLYFLCFTAVGAFGDGGTNPTRLLPIGAAANAADAGATVDAGAAGGNPLDRIPRGVDLSPFLPQGNTLTFTMPADAIASRQGVTRDYGLVMVFNMLCAGQVRLADLDPSAGPQQVPILCTDEEGNKLPPSDYVIGISRVYSYSGIVNTNPVIEKVTFKGADVDLAAGITVPRCVADRRAKCEEHEIDVRVSDSSWEENPTELGVQQLREQLWVTYYMDQGEVGSDARLLFDTRQGRVTAAQSQNKYRAPYDPADGTIWMVVHDNRGGAAWAVIPLHVR